VSHNTRQWENFCNFRLKSSFISETVPGRPTVEQVTAICLACCYQLRQLLGVMESLTPQAAKTLLHAFVTSCCLDNCNALLYDIADNQLQRKHSVQNAAARLVTGCRRSEHITPILRSLLPVCEPATFKLATLVHKCLNGQARRTWLTSVDRLATVAQE